MNYTLLILLVIVLGILFILAIREINCWYFKINKQISIQQAMLRTMLKIFEQNGGEVNWDAFKDEIDK